MNYATELFALQRAIAAASGRWHRARGRHSKISWVVGPAEVASMVANIARAVPNAYSVCLSPHHFYNFRYDYSLASRRGDWVRRLLAVPWLFGRLAAGAEGFIYVGADGFLLTDVDQRVWEFNYLRRHGVKVVCVFTGSDIRSPALMREFERRTGHETIVTYLDQVDATFGTAEYDDARRRIAEVADRCADVIVNPPVDQMSYLQRPTEPFRYFFPDELVLRDDSKHSAPGPKIVVHGPSSPIIKGTQVVRAAVKRLQAEGYEFDYRELIGVPHGEMLEALRGAHIVLNEFYSFVPGVFGVEAMASGCAVLTRADEHLEPSLPQGSNQAWVVTPAADIYANLKNLLDRPEQIQKQATAGRDWAIRHATVSASGKAFRELLASESFPMDGRP